MALGGREKLFKLWIVNAAIKIHKALGPGLLESAYQKCLAHELEKARLHVQCEIPVPIPYGNVRIDAGFRADMIVDEARHQTNGKQPGKPPAAGMIVLFES